MAISPFPKSAYDASPSHSDSSISENDMDEEKEEHTRLQSITTLRFRKYRLAAASVAVILIFVLSFLYDATTAKTIGSPETCGTSTEEALARGCSFDVMSFAWLPARCFDQELMEQFLDIQEWQWYLDSNTTEKADVPGVKAGRYDEVFVTQKYHFYHCTFMWKKMHRAILSGRPIDSYISDFHHTNHCEMQMLDQTKAFNETSTTIYKKYVNCPVEQVSSSRYGWYRMINGHKVHRNP